MSHANTPESRVEKIVSRLRDIGDYELQLFLIAVSDQLKKRVNFFVAVKFSLLKPCNF